MKTFFARCLVLGLLVLAALLTKHVPVSAITTPIPIAYVANSTSLVSSTNVRPAPEFIGITQWLNTNQPIIPVNAKDQVTLVYFCAYSCPTCETAIPKYNALYEKYHDQGLQVIGVFGPSTAAEKNAGQMATTVQSYRINYPVAADPDFATVKAFGATTWPSVYLIDGQGMMQKINNIADLDRQIGGLIGKHATVVLYQ